MPFCFWLLWPFSLNYFRCRLELLYFFTLFIFKVFPMKLGCKSKNYLVFLFWNLQGPSTFSSLFFVFTCVNVWNSMINNISQKFFFNNSHFLLPHMEDWTVTVICDCFPLINFIPPVLKTMTTCIESFGKDRKL